MTPTELPNTLLGYPVHFSEMRIGLLEAANLVLGDWGEYARAKTTMTHNELLALAQERWPELDKVTVRIVVTECSIVEIFDTHEEFIESIAFTGDLMVGYGPKSNTLTIKWKPSSTANDSEITTDMLKQERLPIGLISRRELTRLNSE